MTILFYVAVNVVRSSSSRGGTLGWSAVTDIFAGRIGGMLLSLCKRDVWMCNVAVGSRRSFGGSTRRRVTHSTKTIVNRTLHYNNREQAYIQRGSSLSYVHIMQQF